MWRFDPFFLFPSPTRWLQRERFWTWGLLGVSVTRMTSWLFQLSIRKLRLKASLATLACTLIKLSTPLNTGCWSTSGGEPSRTAAPQQRGGMDDNYFFQSNFVIAHQIYSATLYGLAWLLMTYLLVFDCFGNIILHHHDPTWETKFWWLYSAFYVNLSSLLSKK